MSAPLRPAGTPGLPASGAGFPAAGATPGFPAAGATLAGSVPASPNPARAGRPRLLRLAWMLARPGAQSGAALALPAVAFAITTALILIVAGGTHMFWTVPGAAADIYRFLSTLALSLLLVPLLGLGAAAARLSARRRDDRLATLRLLGATGGHVVVITVIESAAVALLGSLAGAFGAIALLPLVGRLSFLGGPIGAPALWLGVGPTLAVIAAVTLLAGISAAVGLRRVVISPLGVRTRQRPPVPHWIRAVIAVAVVALGMGTLSLAPAMGAAVVLIAALGVSFGLGLAVLNLIGPWLIAVWARGSARRARTVPRLLAARGLLESPQAAWREVSGVALTSFIAVVAGTGLSLLATIGEQPEEDTLVADMFTGIIVTLVGSFLMVAASVGVNQAAAVLDRRELSVSLDRLGMSRAMIESARSRQALAPVILVAAVSALAGGALVFPLTGLALIIAPISVLVLVGAIGLGIGLVWLAVRVTRPVLTRVLATPERA